MRYLFKEIIVYSPGHLMLVWYLKFDERREGRAGGDGILQGHTEQPVCYVNSGLPLLLSFEAVMLKGLTARYIIYIFGYVCCKVGYPLYLPGDEDNGK